MEEEKALEHLLPFEYKRRCPMSHPTQPHTLTSRANQNTMSKCFQCGKQRPNKDCGFFHYHCTICDVDFHSSCLMLPRQITHPFHLQHPLFLTQVILPNVIDGGNTAQGPSEASRFFNNTDQGFDKVPSIDFNCINFEYFDTQNFINMNRDPDKAPSFNSNFSTSDQCKSGLGSILDHCTWCSRYMPSCGAFFYRCHICSFSLDIFCALRDPPLTVENPKGHHHSLIFFPRPLLVPCDACGLVNAREPSYACFQCNYMVHERCIDLPRVIKITRHPHLLSYSPYLPPPNSLCRICYKTVDIKYGQYSCKDEDCSYIIHSKCATHEMVWDGKELEWEPEEPCLVEDMEPFKEVGDGLIKYFCHEHHLKLEKFDKVRDAKKQCEACVLPIDLHDFYNCMQCDFFLHMVCAGLPRKVDHALHNHSLFLDPSPLPSDGNMVCSACSRFSTGFRYRCYEKDCKDGLRFRLDVGCLLVPEYCTEKVHEHPLFIPLDNDLFVCNCCKGRRKRFRLQCTLCEFFICYSCATIPKELHYKHDEHPLTLCYGEETDGKYWCEECEKEVNPTKWFYTCNKCCITIHLDCVFGFCIYLKPGYTFKYFNPEVEVLSNTSSTRSICCRCEDRCHGSTCYKVNLGILCGSCFLEHPKW